MTVRARGSGDIITNNEPRAIPKEKALKTVFAILIALALAAPAFAQNSDPLESFHKDMQRRQSELKDMERDNAILDLQIEQRRMKEEARRQYWEQRDRQDEADRKEEQRRLAPVREDSWDPR